LRLVEIGGGEDSAVYGALKPDACCLEPHDVDGHAGDHYHQDKDEERKNDKTTVFVPMERSEMIPQMVPARLTLTRQFRTHHIIPFRILSDRTLTLEQCSTGVAEVGRFRALRAVIAAPGGAIVRKGGNS
jgi:hypothetical protein